MSWKYVQYENGKYRTTDQGGGGVTDVTVNGTSVVDQDGVAEVTVTDTNVTQENTTESKDYRVLLSGTNDDGTKTEGAHKSTNLKFNPNVGDLKTLKLNGVTIGNNPVFTDQYVSQTETPTSYTVDEDFEVLLAYTSDNITRTEGARKSNGLTFNPNTHNMAVHKATLKKLVNKVFNDGVVSGGSTSGNTHYPETWVFNQSTTSEDGGRVVIKCPSGGHENGVWISVNNGSTYRPIALNGQNMLTTQFAQNTYIELICEENGQVEAYSRTGSAGTTTITGIWRVLNINTELMVHIVPYSGTTNSNGNLSITALNGKRVFGATVDNASTYVACGTNAGGGPMLCFRHTNTNAALASTAVSGYVFYSD